MNNPNTPGHHTSQSATPLTQAQIEQAVAKSAEGIVQALGLLQDLEERGVLPLTRALIEQGDDVVKIILALANNPAYAGGLKNALALVKGVAAVQPETMATLSNSVQAGLQEAAAVQTQEESSLGVYDALKALRDPDVNRAISFGLAFLKGMGKALAQPEDAEA
ncbi:DUF1641 domain-containing protein [Alicyclobacillus fodiniaquatilis]|uniref:DUF1641 domain-containing protein n=1 Tax=Alicyclobacillus fodiniaquatilis TaxID=1661150 RepID=A0ABW4JBV6_9BACL